MFPIEPKSGVFLLLPIAHWNATGISDSPMTVMMVPVTTAGNSRTSWAKKDDRSRPIRPATMIAPKTGRKPSALAIV